MSASHRRGFITGGTWCVDNNILVSHWPAEDGIAEILSVERHGGGSGCNLALDMKQLDPEIPVETIGIIGEDEDGRFLIALADEAGVGRSQMHVTGQDVTQYTDAFASAASRRRTHIYRPGTAALLTPDHFDFATTNARWLHLGLPGVHRLMDRPWAAEENGWVAVLKRARAAGLKTNLELASVGAETIARLVRPCLPHLDAIIVNDTEIGAISGLTTLNDGVTDRDACTRALRKVLDMGAMELAVMHCPTMAIAAARDGCIYSRPSVSVPADQIAGANGAGDAFAAGMMYGLHEGWGIDDCLALAHASAAASLRSVSTTGAVVSWRQCLELAGQWGWRTF